MSGRISQRSRAAVTWRTSAGSGVTSVAERPSAAAWRRRMAIATASTRVDGASISVMPLVASTMPARPGPSRSHWSVTGAGRSASETILLRAASAGESSVQGRMSCGARSSCCISWANRYCG